VVHVKKWHWHIISYGLYRLGGCEFWLELDLQPFFIAHNKGSLFFSPAWTYKKSTVFAKNPSNGFFTLFCSYTLELKEPLWYNFIYSSRTGAANKLFYLF